MPATLSAQHARAPSADTRLCAGVVFVGAWLVFWVQPLSVRPLLPALGGAPGVWLTASVCFQAALLAGYALAHALSKATVRTQGLVLAALWAAVALTAPVGSPRPWGTTPAVGVAPALWVLGTLLAGAGLACAATATLSPLMAHWTTRLGEARGRRTDPYALYAVSNTGAAGALFAFPLLLEPTLGLEAQSLAWSAIAAALAVPVAWLGWRSCATVRPGGRKAAPPEGAHAPRATASTARILALAGLPGALLVAVTGHITTDIASVPLLWMVPLGLYLATFVYAFAEKTPDATRLLDAVLTPALIVLCVLEALGARALGLGALHLAVFAAASLRCHVALSHARPHARALTGFYLKLAAGGCAGSALVALGAPALLDAVYEYPIALALVAALGAPTGRRLTVHGAIAVALATGVAVVALSSLSLIPAHERSIVTAPEHWTLASATAVGLSAVTAPALLALRAHPRALALALGALALVPQGVERWGPNAPLEQTRTFFGVYHVSETPALRSFYHGTTLHGIERARPDATREARSAYYGPGTPYAQVLEAVTARRHPQRLGVAGLGIGALACYARTDDTVTFYEIDPVVVELARRWFTPLNTCAPDADIVIGDARLSLAGATEPFDLLALDAFTSGAIPVHLLTVEAFETYLAALKPDGLLAVHISNNHVDLAPVVGALASELGLAARVRAHMPDDAQRAAFEALPSRVVVLARNTAVLDGARLREGWVTLRAGEDARAWTDDWTPLIGHIEW